MSIKTEDLFSEYLNKKEKSNLVKRALIDKSFKKAYEKENKTPYPDKDNSDLATYGDAVIKLSYLDIFLDQEKKLTIKKSEYESDKYLVKVVAKYYDLLKYIKKDDNDKNKPNDYNYEHKKNKNPHKYIATAVEAMIVAIYIEENKNIDPIIPLLKKWISLGSSNE